MRGGLGGEKRAGGKGRERGKEGRRNRRKGKEGVREETKQMGTGRKGKREGKHSIGRKGRVAKKEEENKKN